MASNVNICPKHFFSDSIIFHFHDFFTSSIFVIKKVSENRWLDVGHVKSKKGNIPQCWLTGIMKASFLDKFQCFFVPLPNESFFEFCLLVWDHLEETFALITEDVEESTLNVVWTFWKGQRSLKWILLVLPCNAY